MQNHIIQQLKVEAKASNFRDAVQYQQRLSYWIHTNSFSRQLEDVLDELVPDKDYLLIDQLEVELDGDNEQILSEQFFTNLKKTIREKIKDHRSGSVQLISKNVFEETAILYFLAHGFMPKGSDNELAEKVHSSIKDLQEKENERLTALIFETGRSNPYVWIRIYYLMGPQGIKSFLLCHHRVSNDFLEWMARFENELTANTKLNNSESGNKFRPGLPVWQVILQQLSEGRSPEDITQTLIGPDNLKVPKGTDAGELTEKKVDRHTNLNEMLKDPDTRQTLSENELKDHSFYVPNAGLVMIWAEFGLLAKNLGLVSEKNFKNVFAQQQAILLLHYLITAETSARENELLLHKLLCDWPLDLPVDPSAFPDESIQKLADETMEDFVSKWTNERKFTADWLRRNFFQRDGKLSLRDDGNWELQVTRKTEDALFDIPNSRIIKPAIVRYSWMKKLLFVQW